MSASSKRGQGFEAHVAKMIRSKLGARVARDGRSGAGSHQKMDITNYYQDIPLAIECKDHENIKVKEWMRQAIDAASFHQVPTLVFAMETETLACVRFDDLLNFIREIADLRAEVDDLRAPIPATSPPPSPQQRRVDNKKVDEIQGKVQKVVQTKKMEGFKTDKNGHIVDDYGHCMQKGCKYNRNYKPPKAKK